MGSLDTISKISQVSDLQNECVNLKVIQNTRNCCKDPPTLTILITQFPMLQRNTFFPLLQDFFFIRLHQAEMSKKIKEKHAVETWYVVLSGNVCCSRYLTRRAQGLPTLYVADTHKSFAPCLASYSIFFFLPQSFSESVSKAGKKVFQGCS